jgi:hypothetical protein
MFRLLFLTSPLVFSFPRIVVGCVLFLFRSGGVLPVFCFYPDFLHLQVFLDSLFVSFLSSFLPWPGPPGLFLFHRRKISRMSFSAAGKCKVQLPHGIFPQSFFPQEVEMDFHRNAHGKSRSNCFPVPGSFVALVVFKSVWLMLSV